MKPEVLEQIKLKKNPDAAVIKTEPKKQLEKPPVPVLPPPAVRKSETRKSLANDRKSQLSMASIGSKGKCYNIIGDSHHITYSASSDLSPKPDLAPFF